MPQPWKLVIGLKHVSTWSLRPWLALKQAEIPFEEIQIKDKYTQVFRDEVRKYANTDKVPILVTPEVTIPESLAICEYAAEFEPSLWPKNRAVRAHARAISNEMHAGFATLRDRMSAKFLQTGLTAVYNAELEKDIRRIDSIWTECRSRYQGDGEFLFGSFTIADAMYAPVVSRFRTYGVQVGSLSRTYMDTIWNLPSMREWMDDAKKER